VRPALAILALTLVLAGSTAAWGAEPPNAADLEAELVCPTCSTTLDQSDAPVARRMKAYIRERIAAGATAKQIKDELVAEFGTRVLAEPPRRGFDLLAWALPLAVLAVGAVGVVAAALAWRRRRRRRAARRLRLVPRAVRAAARPRLPLGGLRR
jgi:cytochrome c-type biogenesis protein CcmH